jgi:hypothetical protein
MISRFSVDGITCGVVVLHTNVSALGQWSMFGILEYCQVVDQWIQFRGRHTRPKTEYRKYNEHVTNSPGVKSQRPHSPVGKLNGLKWLEENI